MGLASYSLLDILRRRAGIRAAPKHEAHRAASSSHGRDADGREEGANVMGLTVARGFSCAVVAHLDLCRGRGAANVSVRIQSVCFAHEEDETLSLSHHRVLILELV